MAAQDTTPEAADYDVIVVGSGASGLAAALTAGKLGLSVCVLEKEDLIGGTTARSGGVLWIPCNPVNRRAGVNDSPEAAREYLQAIIGNGFDTEKIDAFLRNGPDMVSFFSDEIGVGFLPQTAFPDYRPDLPGGLEGGRSIVAAPFDGRRLGDDFKRLRPPLRTITFVGMMFNASQEVQHFFNATRSLRSALYVARRLVAHGIEVARYGRATRLTNGNALVGQLLAAARRANIPVLTSTALTELDMTGGRVTGVHVEAGGSRRRMHARKGVILATGGFPQDRDRRAALFPHGNAHRSPAPDGNTGDGLRAARAAGARLDEALPNAAAWIPVSIVPFADGTTGHFPHLIDRYKPGVIIVNRHGHRFVNEAESYHEVGKAILGDAQGEEPLAWLICDDRALRKYGLGFVKPFPVPKRGHVASGYLKEGRTVADLATQIDVPVTALAATIALYNSGAAEGRDPEFGKGSSAYNRYLGDPAHTPNPCNAPLDTAPFYAIRLYLGDLGTFAGIETNGEAQVLGADRQPVAGLYAVGNDMASVMGGQYPGGGITLGPGMTFGYVAARHIASQQTSQTS